MGGRLNIERIFGWTRRRTPLPPDAAEVGTAFGMELSLQAESGDADIDPPGAAAEPGPGTVAATAADAARRGRP